MGWVTDWSAQAACRTTDPDELFVQGAAQNRAKAVCTGCPVRTECLADALDNRVEFGVWGGMTERERRALLRRRPTVTSWRRLLETARTEYERGTGILPSTTRRDAGLTRTYVAVPCGVSRPGPVTALASAGRRRTVSLRPVTGREPVADVPQPREVVHVAGQGGDLGHGHLRVHGGEAVPGALLAGEQLHASACSRSRPAVSCRRTASGRVGVVSVSVRAGCRRVSFASGVRTRG